MREQYRSLFGFTLTRSVDVYVEGKTYESAYGAMRFIIDNDCLDHVDLFADLSNAAPINVVGGSHVSYEERLEESCPVFVLDPTSLRVMRSKDYEDEHPLPRTPAERMLAEIRVTIDAFYAEHIAEGSHAAEAWWHYTYEALGKRAPIDMLVSDDIEELYVWVMKAYAPHTPTKGT